MKERPILFAGPMVRAILAGQKTQTRRVLGPDFNVTGPNPPEPGLFDVHRTKGPGKGWAGAVRRDGRGSGATLCPYGVPGDRLWVRETWARNAEDMGSHMNTHVIFRADGEVRAKDNGTDLAWRPSIHMPRRASRIALEVTEVRVQRVQEISEEDAKAEGVDACTGAGRSAFWRLWDSINAKRGYSWQNNPFVWAITFRRLA